LVSVIAAAAALWVVPEIRHALKLPDPNYPSDPTVRIENGGISPKPKGTHSETSRTALHHTLRFVAKAGPWRYALRVTLEKDGQQHTRILESLESVGNDPSASFDLPVGKYHFDAELIGKQISVGPIDFLLDRSLKCSVYTVVEGSRYMLKPVCEDLEPEPPPPAPEKPWWKIF
jgi:hypothetical protein